MTWLPRESDFSEAPITATDPGCSRFFSPRIPCPRSSRPLSAAARIAKTWFSPLEEYQPVGFRSRLLRGGWKAANFDAGSLLQTILIAGNVAPDRGGPLPRVCLEPPAGALSRQPIQ